MSSDGLLVIGSGPGIGVTTASLFAQKKFTKIALIARDNSRLTKDRETILQAAKSAGKTVEVQTWSVDITNSTSFKAVLKETEKFATFSCVFFNAARVEPSDLLSFPEEEILKDFKTTTIALYTISHWALPILNSLPASSQPSLLITSSLLPHEPVPYVFSLSLVKASQRNLAQSLALTYPDVHVALLNVGGPVSWEDKWFNPPAIAKKFWELYTQEKDKWTLDLDLLAYE
ncbi:putative NADP(+)-dependent dehydrogenase [Stipitochalara longipes BDJ]|nr:putative NADP(+)-dependent dehydrogenase [Stipitochalara longipes BDJ]